MQVRPVPDRCSGILRLCLAVLPVLCGSGGAAADLPGFDFTQPGTAAEWAATHHVAAIEGTAAGLAIGIAGDDPYVTGPPRDYPPDLPLRISLRVRPDADGMLQVFYFTTRASEEKAVIFPVRAGIWNDVHALLPPLGPGTRLRIDPPGVTGTATVARIGFEPAASLPAPRWPPHEAFDTAAGERLESGPLEVAVGTRGFGLTVAGRRVAASHAKPLIGYVVDGAVRWAAADAPADVRRAEDGRGGAAIEAVQSIRDADGGTWRIARRFTAGSAPGLVDLEVTVAVDEDRAVAFLPLLLLVAHEGSPRKQQAVFPGLEYLGDEPSSSEADLVGPQARRQVPANHKIAFPLMAVAREGRAVALAWDHAPAFAALFDSPDRVLASGGHLCGVIMPGSDGLNRHEGSLMPIAPAPLRAAAPLVLRATLWGGVGDTVVPALQAYVQARGLPRASEVGGLAGYVRGAAAGWLDSGVHVGGRFRHAIGANFPPQPAADAAVFTAWLAQRAVDADTATRLEAASAAASEALPPDSPEDATIGHVHQSGQSLVVGRVEEAMVERAATARRLLAGVRADGTVAYRPGSGGIDYGRTHDADHASGLSAHAVAEALDAARFSGDAALIDEAIAALRRLGRAYAGGVPRGAQTWEVPLHTPDILASAHFVKAFTIGYELTGDRDLFDQAVAWAWTGLPFLYLVDPVGTPDGAYGCVTVFGATGWKWPVWIGRPVQWCGLVYAHALYRLARHDSTGPWRQLADGITATAIRYSWPAAGPGAAPDAVERQGLLPDGWDVCEAFPIDPPINPGTVQACAAELFRQPPPLDCRVVRWTGGRMIIHAPGTIEPRPAATGAEADAIEVAVTGWPTKPHAVLVTGLVAAPAVSVDGRTVDLAPPHRFDAATGTLVLRLDAPHTLTLRPGKPR